MILHKVGPNKVQSDSGFSLWMKNPFTLIYKEGSHKCTFGAEMLSQGADLLVTVSTVSNWDPPYESERMDVTKMSEIRVNVGSALRFMRVEPEFD